MLFQYLVDKHVKREQRLQTVLCTDTALRILVWCHCSLLPSPSPLNTSINLLVSVVVIRIINNEFIRFSHT